MSSTTDNEFNARAYWEERLSSDYSLGGVGYHGMAESYNRWMYRVRRRVFLRTAARLWNRPGEIQVLDVGSGTGFYIDLWHELGAGAVTGSDLTEVAASKLRRRNPSDDVMQLDISASQLPFDECEFDALSMMDVVFHIVDDARFAQAFKNAFRLLKPGGYLLFTENFVRGPAIRIRHHVSRSLAEIEGVVREQGFEVISRRPLFWLMNNPVDGGSRLHRLWWRALHRFVGESNLRGNIAGALVYPVELALVSHLLESPTTELMVCRRPPAECPDADVPE